MVPRLPPAPGALCAAPRRSVQHELRGSRKPARARATARGGESHQEDDGLQRMSPMKPFDAGRGKPDSAPEFWRTLEEKNGANLDELVGDEFASRLPDSFDPIERRSFLKLMGASFALAGMAGCTRQPPEQILPYVRQPENIVPGRPLFYATAMTVGGHATGLLVESHEGRPTKIEGNPSHPGSLGATDVFGQAAVLGLYDPDRAQTLLSLGEIRPWPRFLGAIRAVLTAQQPVQGRGLRLLTESISSPTLAAQIRELLGRYPAARWHQWDPAGRENARAGARL